MCDEYTQHMPKHPLFMPQSPSKQLAPKHISERTWYHDRSDEFTKQMLHNTALHWLLWCIWSVYLAGHNSSQRRSGVRQARQRQENRVEGVNGYITRIGKLTGCALFRSGTNQRPCLRQCHHCWWARVARDCDKNGTEMDECNEKQQDSGSKSMLHNQLFVSFNGLVFCVFSFLGGGGIQLVNSHVFFLLTLPVT